MSWEASNSVTSIESTDTAFIGGIPISRPSLTKGIVPQIDTAATGGIVEEIGASWGITGANGESVVANRGILGASEGIAGASWGIVGASGGIVPLVDDDVTGGREINVGAAAIMSVGFVCGTFMICTVSGIGTEWLFNSSTNMMTTDSKLRIRTSRSLRSPKKWVDCFFKDKLT